MEKEKLLEEIQKTLYKDYPDDYKIEEIFRLISDFIIKQS